MFTSIILFVFTILADPTILVQKEIVTIPVGEGYDMKVHVHIHNVGSEPVYDVKVEDKWNAVFEVSPNAPDQNKCFYDTIEGNTNVTCEEIFTPKRYGVINLDTVKVSYHLSREEEETMYYVVAHPRAEMTLDVLPTALYRRYYTSHVRQAFVFIFLCCFLTLLPYARHRSTKTVNDFIRKGAAPQRRKQK